MHRAIKTDVIIKVLHDLGYTNIRSKGAHTIFRHHDITGIVVLPTRIKELSAGTYASIRRHVINTGLIDEVQFDKLVQKNS
jgi:predicted RNA binding protein YcfA (HicA-like mRNA interferase family)